MFLCASLIGRHREKGGEHIMAVKKKAAKKKAATKKKATKKKATKKKATKKKKK